MGSLAAVRCCSISNSGVAANVREANKTSCTPICSALDARGQHTYSMPKLNADGLAANLTEAKAECRAVAGRRLCSREELLAGVCCKTAAAWTPHWCGPRAPVRDLAGCIEARGASVALRDGPRECEAERCRLQQRRRRRSHRQQQQKQHHQ